MIYVAMSETEMKQAAEQNENIRVAVDEEWELPEEPYFYSPYPRNLVQVHIPETRGGREVVRVINEHWPKTISELEELSAEETGDGYSGSFIRNILRSHYAPEDILNVREEVEEEVTIEEEPQEINRDEMEEQWHRVFRMGIRVALENEIDREEVFTAFESGFIEGQKLKEEM